MWFWLPIITNTAYGVCCCFCPSFLQIFFFAYIRLWFECRDKSCVPLQEEFLSNFSTIFRSIILSSTASTWGSFPCSIIPFHEEEEEVASMCFFSPKQWPTHLQEIKQHTKTRTPLKGNPTNIQTEIEEARWVGGVVFIMGFFREDKIKSYSQIFRDPFWVFSWFDAVPHTYLYLLSLYF